MLNKLLFGAILPLALTAQETRDVVPLKNWSNPLYFQLNQTEREIRKPLPELQFSATQVSSDALSFVAITPCRLLDTRGTTTGFSSGSPYNVALAAAGTLTIPVQADASNAACGTVPSVAKAYSFNVTLIPVAAGQVGYVTVWPAGATQPVVATINDREGVVLANAAIVPAGTPSGGISVYNSGPAATNVVIDMNGFFAAPTDLYSNTAVGSGALATNTTGANNTAVGETALNNNTTGTNNAAFGQGALLSNTSGDGNTAVGEFALSANTTGSGNTAIGSPTLSANTTGYANTAVGTGALDDNTTGHYNTAIGGALLNNSTGDNNTATGVQALNNNTTGGNNTAFGTAALFLNGTGSGNIALGYQAGSGVPVGNSNSIYVGSIGSPSDASGTIQIGTQGTQTGGTFIAGISGATSSSGVEVFINEIGQLGTMTSSGRFKEQITDMGDTQQQTAPVASGEFLLQAGVRRWIAPPAIWSGGRRSRQGVSRDGGVRQRRQAMDGPLSVARSDAAE